MRIALCQSACAEDQRILVGETVRGKHVLRENARCSCSGSPYQLKSRRTRSPSLIHPVLEFDQWLLAKGKDASDLQGTLDVIG